MRVAIVPESFLPVVNGVVNSVLRVLEHLKANGHEAIVIASGARDFQEEIPDYLGFPIYRVPTIMVPFIDSMPIGVPMPTMTRIMREFQPDVVHLASPFVLGGAGARVARQLKIPAVAVYQTDVAGFAAKYHLGPLATAAWEWTRVLHNSSERTLAPSSVTISELEAHGIKNIYHWGRGVDSVRFHPDKRSNDLRRAWDPTCSKRIVGFVGRLAAEKGVARLAALRDRRDLQLVIVGDGPERKSLEQRMPNAVFTGALGGEDLARAYASMDLFVHPGEFETFCQTIQEALASGVPAIGPRAGGPIDLITPGVDGDLLDVATFESELPGAVDYILAPDHYSRMVFAARDGVRTKTWDSLCRQMVGHYRAVIDQYDPSPRWLRAVQHH